MNLIILFPVLFVVIVYGIIAILWKKNKSKYHVDENERRNQQIKTAQEFTNVSNIEDIFLYTKDNYIISYIQVSPIEIELLTQNEREVLERNLTSEFSIERQAFKFLAVSKPIDNSQLLNEYSDLLSNTTDQIRKKLLRSESQYITDLSITGENVEREFYYILWERNGEQAENELKKRTRDLSNRIAGTGIESKVLKKPDIIKLCNLINNPAFINFDSLEVELTMPYLRTSEEE